MFTPRGIRPPARIGPARRVAIWATFLLPSVLLLAGVSAFGFEQPDPAEQARIAGLLGLRPGMTVADVGAGDGRYVPDLAARVGSGGYVYATEVDPARVESIRERLGDDGPENVSVVLGDQENTGLERDCCDAILLRHVYHHFVNPSAMRASLDWALRSQGRLLVIDFEPSESRGHGLSMDELVAEMTAHGWRVERRVTAWNGSESHYAVLFRLEEPAT